MTLLMPGSLETHWLPFVTQGRSYDWLSQRWRWTSIGCHDQCRMPQKMNEGSHLSIQSCFKVPGWMGFACSHVNTAFISDKKKLNRQQATSEMCWHVQSLLNTIKTTLQCGQPFMKKTVQNNHWILRVWLNNRTQSQHTFWLVIAGVTNCVNDGSALFKCASKPWVWQRACMQNIRHLKHLHFIYPSFSMRDMSKFLQWKRSTLLNNVI